ADAPRVGRPRAPPRALHRRALGHVRGSQGRDPPPARALSPEPQRPRRRRSDDDLRNPQFSLAAACFFFGGAFFFAGAFFFDEGGAGFFEAVDFVTGRGRPSPSP